MDIIQTILDIQSLLAHVGPKNYKHVSSMDEHHTLPSPCCSFSTVIVKMEWERLES